MSRLQVITHNRGLPPVVGRFHQAPVPQPVATETTGGVARPFLRHVDPRVRLLRRMAQPLYAPVDLSEGPRARLQVTGSATGGGEALMATIVPGSGPLELGSDEVGVLFALDTAPWLGGGEALAPLGVVPVVKAYPFLGAQGTDVAASLVAGLSVEGPTIYLALGKGATPPGTYRVRLRVPTVGGVTRQILWPSIACRS